MDFSCSALDTPKVLIPKDEIHREVLRLAQEIRHDYQGKNPLVIGILKGSFVFLADLIRMVDIPVEIEAEVAIRAG